MRNLTYKVPVDFFQENMVLFIATEDLLEAKRRIMAYLRDEMRRASPFFFELVETAPKKLDLSDLIAKYNHVGKKSIADDYYISPDRKMQLLLIKPMWDANDLGRTKALVERLDVLFADYSRKNAQGAKLVEDYELLGEDGTIAYGYAGSYKTNVDDSYAIMQSLKPVTVVAFFGVFLVTFLFFRRFWPSLIVILGTAIGTVLTLGFTYLAVGQLNMVTSMLAGLLLGFGVDFGIHFMFRTRIELGLGKRYDEALEDAVVFAGRPAAVAAASTGGAFLLLLVSEFRGFSQLGLLAGVGTVIIWLTLFSFTPAVLSLLGRRRADLPERVVGRMAPLAARADGREPRVPRPRLLLALASLVFAVLVAAAIPWRSEVSVTPEGRAPFSARLHDGVRFNYDTRALFSDEAYSIKLQDEISRRFQISSDPTGVYTRTVAEAKALWDELTQNPDKYRTVDQVVSMFSFVPDQEVARANAEVLAAWRKELAEIDPSIIPESLRPKLPLFEKVLAAKPFDVDGLPKSFLSMFKNLPSARPENHGYLTFVYPKVDLWDGQETLKFADEISVIRSASGEEYRAAGLPLLYAKLARMVLFDGKLTLVLAAAWLLFMVLFDFRSWRLALAAIIPLGVGLVATLGLMALLDRRLNFMNIIILPILLGFGVSHGLYLLHRFVEGGSPVVALRSVGTAVASSTLTTIAGFGALLLASHNGLKSMGFLACLGLATMLVVSFTVLAAVLQLLHDRRARGRT